MERFDMSEMLQHPSDAQLASALQWLAQHGDLLEFECRDDEVPELRAALANRGLSFFDTGGGPLTAEGRAFLASYVHLSKRPRI